MPYAGRVPNSAYFFFVWGCMYWLFCTLAFLKKKYNFAMNGIIYKRIQWASACMIMLVCLLPNNIRAAFGDLITGRAQAFDAQLSERYEILRNCKGDTCLVPPITMHTASIWYTDITDSVTGQENTRHSLYFGKQAIRLVKTP